jgi:hypothetical protein
MGDSAMLCDGLVGGEPMRTAERIEELEATKRIDEKGDVKFRFRIIAMSVIQAIHGLFNMHHDCGHAAAMFNVTPRTHLSRLTSFDAGILSRCWYSFTSHCFVDSF